MHMVGLRRAIHSLRKKNLDNTEGRSSLGEIYILYDNVRWRSFQRTGCLLTADGSDDSSEDVPAPDADKKQKKKKLYNEKMKNTGRSTKSYRLRLGTSRESLSRS